MKLNEFITVASEKDITYIGPMLSSQILRTRLQVACPWRAAAMT